MELFVRLTRWAGYLGGELALAEIHEQGAKYVVEVAEATAFLSNWGGTRDERVAATKAERTLDPDVEDSRDAAQLAYARRKLLTAMYNDVERSAQTVSRELTRRTSMEPPNRRSDRWSP